MRRVVRVYVLWIERHHIAIEEWIVFCTYDVYVYVHILTIHILYLNTCGFDKVMSISISIYRIFMLVKVLRPHACICSDRSAFRFCLTINGTLCHTPKVEVLLLLLLSLL